MRAKTPDASCGVRVRVKITPNGFIVAGVFYSDHVSLKGNHKMVL